MNKSDRLSPDGCAAALHMERCGLDSSTTLVCFERYRNDVMNENEQGAESSSLEPSVDSKGEMEASQGVQTEVPFSIAAVASQVETALRAMPQREHPDDTPLELSLLSVAAAVHTAFRNLGPNGRFLHVSGLTQAIAVVEAAPVPCELFADVAELVRVLHTQVERWWIQPPSVFVSRTYWRNQVCGCEGWKYPENVTPPRHNPRCRYRQ